MGGQDPKSAKKHICIGLLAHVDAGKTTLAEAMLYQTGKLKKLGRVDHGDTCMDTHALERERGITIFASQAEITLGDLSATLLDTPGHVDFSAETERMLQVLDYAVLVISGSDGVQAHTHTLWKLLELYHIPTFVFITKMDLARKSRQALMMELQGRLSENCVDFSPEEIAQRAEQLALCQEDVLERYLRSGAVTEADAARLICSRLAFPCYFGSGLRLEGVAELLQGLAQFTVAPVYPDAFGAKVFKISHDPQGNRLTHMKITGGSLKVRSSLRYDGLEEKPNQLRLYSGAKYTTVEEVAAGWVCAVTGLTATKSGQGFGLESVSQAPALEPVMNYRIVLPPDCNPRIALPKLRQLEEEDPQLRITWDNRLQEIHVSLMGAVQMEILKSLILERFDLAVEVDSGRVLYKETIEDIVEGVGHYEPLRHYAEVHLLLEPLPRGSGLVFASRCSEDALDRSWQRLILTHLAEKQHLGVLIGAPITDMKLTLTAGRAHIKHTEGGDFRQATYRAVRQGLMQAKTVLLEPYYSFRLEVPPEQLGRAISDIRARFGSFDPPESCGEMTLLRGKAPVSAMNGYVTELAAYTRGRGRLLCEAGGYDVCHNPQEVIASFGYDPEGDLDNPPDSVFCAHGGGFSVKWDRVSEYMHLESCLKKPEEVYVPKINRRNLRLDEKELEAIMEREFGPVKRPLYRTPEPEKKPAPPEQLPFRPQSKYLIVDGYNVIFCWEDLSRLAQTDLESARTQLMDILCNYSAYTRSETVLVFDAYRVPGNLGKHFDFHNLHVVYTKQNETGDMYIEKLTAQIGKNEQVRVVTSDALIQLSALRSGVLRVSAAEFGREVDSVSGEIDRLLDRLHRTKLGTIGENLKQKGEE